MISTEADANQSNGIKTPLIVPCEKGGYYCGETFDKGWGWYQSVENKTPLIVACLKKYWSVVKELRKAITDAIKSNSSENTPQTVEVKWGIMRCSITW